MRPTWFHLSLRVIPRRFARLLLKCIELNLLKPDATAGRLHDTPLVNHSFNFVIEEGLLAFSTRIAMILWLIYFRLSNEVLLIQVMSYLGLA